MVEQNALKLGRRNLQTLHLEISIPIEILQALIVSRAEAHQSDVVLLPALKSFSCHFDYQDDLNDIIGQFILSRVDPPLRTIRLSWARIKVRVGRGAVAGPFSDFGPRYSVQMIYGE